MKKKIVKQIENEYKRKNKEEKFNKIKYYLNKALKLLGESDLDFIILISNERHA